MGKSTFQESNPDKSFVSIGSVSEQVLTYGTNASGDNDKKTVGIASGELRAAETNGVGCIVEIYVPSAADTGIHVAFGEAATTDHFLIPAGASKIFNTRQAINAIRGGSADADVYLLRGEVS